LDEEFDDCPPPPTTTEVFVGSAMSRLAMTLNSLALLLLLAGSAGFVWLMSSLPYVDGHIPIVGLEREATIARDKLGVPLITARTQHDAYYALGFTHAQDRIWQMELQRRIGAGRMAEAVGPRGLANDRFMRALNLYHLADAGFAALDQPTRGALLAYATGVNAWLDSHRHRLPLEFTLLGITPEPWTPADSLVWGRVMALQLSGNWHEELNRMELAGTLDPRRLGELFPPYPADAPVTVPGKAAAALREATPEDARPRLASNLWLVGGLHTASGRPLFANDIHLPFQAPVLWYLARMEAPGLSLSGATIPGLPFHLIGHNGRVAWGFTTTHADTIDLFVEKPAGDGKYQAPGGPRSFEVRREVIRVKDQADEVLEVRSTRHGPIISDLVPGHGNDLLAFSAPFLVADDLTPQAFHRLNRATDWKGFTTALKDFHNPVQNIGYADTSGTIAFITAGRLPLRKSGNGTRPAPGWSGETDWTGWAPFAKLPQTVNPRSGTIVNANNKVVPDGYPVLIAADWPDGYRAQRIADLLADRKGLVAEDMAAMQQDTLSLGALELKELVSEVEAKSGRARDAARLIAAWDARAEAGRPEPLIFAAWMARLNRAIFADELKGHFAMMEPFRASALAAALTRNRHWCDDVATPDPESCDEVVARSLEQAVTDLTTAYGPDMAAWRWGDAHHARFASRILGSVPLLSYLTDIEVATSGDDFTIGRGSYMAPPAGKAEFPHVHGAGLRVIYDLADLSKSRFIMATGQSGNPLSRHYRDMVSSWVANHGVTLEHHDAAAVLSMDPSW
jgi:penicillin amidase